MKRQHRRPAVLGVSALLMAVYVLLRLHPALIRPPYAPQSVLVNPAGTCALVEYKFGGGERWSWFDPYALFTLSSGDAFYTIVDLGTGKIVRDNTDSLMPIKAYSQESAGMGDSVFYWSRDGASAAFPGGEGPNHEWTDIKQCVGTQSQSAFANANCEIDDATPTCQKLRSKLAAGS